MALFHQFFFVLTTSDVMTGIFIYISIPFPFFTSHHKTPPNLLFHFEITFGLCKFIRLLNSNISSQRNRTRAIRVFVYCWMSRWRFFLCATTWVAFYDNILAHNWKRKREENGNVVLSHMASMNFKRCKNVILLFVQNRHFVQHIVRL